MSNRLYAYRTECPKCLGTGEQDSGGVMPWGEHVNIPCDCKEWEGDTVPNPSKLSVQPCA
jgi:hypothetical protein